MNTILQMTPKIVLVTGGNGGIGYEAVKALFEAEKPYHIFMGSRSVEKATEAIKEIQTACPKATNKIEPLQVDLTSDESIEYAFEKVKSGPGYIDALVNNAATFIPLLLKSVDPRLIFVTGLSAINQAAESYFPTPPQPAGWPKNIEFETIGYRCSKVALNMMMLDWNHKLKADGVKVCCVGPGMLATNLGNVREMALAMGAKHPSIGGQLLRTVVEGERDDCMGKIIIRAGVMDW
ncbi:hypothetical protein N7486_001173 [Penicillium sp. IBT 16267x]|nr:hypothetical protein N7486_001173 [Penicillium sp. IBT 16267x]